MVDAKPAVQGSWRRQSPTVTGRLDRRTSGRPPHLAEGGDPRDEGRKGNVCDRLKTGSAIVPRRIVPRKNVHRQEEWRGKAVVCMGDGLLTWLLGPACGGMMRRTSGWGGLLRLPEGPRTTAPVPCHSGGSAGLGPRYSYRSFGGGGATIRPRLRHGVL